MIKAKEFGNWCYHTLTEDETKLLADTLVTIISNHSNETWSQVYLGITESTHRTLMRIYADEYLEEGESNESN